MVHRRNTYRVFNESRKRFRRQKLRISDSELCVSVSAILIVASIYDCFVQCGSNKTENCIILWKKLCTTSFFTLHVGSWCNFGECFSCGQRYCLFFYFPFSFQGIHAIHIWVSAFLFLFVNFKFFIAYCVAGIKLCRALKRNEMK